MSKVSRRNLGFGFATLAAMSAVSPVLANPTAPVIAVYELTFLKARHGDTASLSRFISLNWFAMDRLAVQQGLMTDYRLLISADGAPEWDTLVIDGYPKVEGYSGVAKAFEAIRAAHTTIPVIGKTLDQLGEIVASRRLLPG